MQAATLSDQSCAVLYVDIRTAFAAMQRCTAFQDEHSEDSLTRWLVANNFTEDMVWSVLEALRRFTFDLEAEFTPPIYALLLTSTSVRGSPLKVSKVLFTAVKARARGAPLAISSSASASRKCVGVRTRPWINKG